MNMSYETYNAFATTVKEEMPLLDYEQQLEILTIVISAMNVRKKTESIMSKDEKLALFDKFNGCLKVPADFNLKKEYLEYLDERYGI